MGQKKKMISRYPISWCTPAALEKHPHAFHPGHFVPLKGQNEGKTGEKSQKMRILTQLTVNMEWWFWLKNYPPCGHASKEGCASWPDFAD